MRRICGVASAGVRWSGVGSSRRGPGAARNVAEIPATGLTADQVAERLADHCVRIGPMGEGLMRAVTHLDVTTEQVAEAAAAVKAVVEAT